MKNCLLFLMAITLFTKAQAQPDSTSSQADGPFAAYSVQTVDNMVLLKWSVQETEGAKTFDIERAYGDEIFFKVGSKLAISKSAGGGYDFVDATPKKNATLLYRLKLIFEDGHSVYSPVKNAGVVSSAFVVRLKQNPVRNSVDVEVEGASSKQAFVAVVSQAGQQLSSQTFSLPANRNQLSIPVQTMGQGLYRLVVEAGNERKTIPFVKE